MIHSWAKCHVFKKTSTVGPLWSPLLIYKLNIIKEANNIRNNRNKEKELVNENIPNIELLLIDDEGTNLGKMNRDKALELAYKKDLDLVVVAPEAKAQLLANTI